MTTNSDRLIGVDVLRALAIIGVLACHLALTHASMQATDPIDAWASRVAPAGGYGVVLFFAISGFVITRTTRRRDGTLAQIRINSFYSRRIGRIFPALALSIALGVFALIIISAGSVRTRSTLTGDTPFTIDFWLSIFTFTFNYYRAAAIINGHDFGLHWIVLWSLSVEEQFYLFFPLIARLSVSRPKFWLVLGLLVICGVSVRTAVQLSGASEGWVIITPACVDALAIGVAAAAAPSFPYPKEWVPRAVAVGCVMLILGFVSGVWAAKPLLVALGAALIMLCCQNGGVFTSRLWLPWARIGRVSYGIYLFHPLVLYCLWPLMQTLPYLPALALFVGASTLVAEVSFAVVEQPAARWLRARWPSSSAVESRPSAAKQV